MSQTNRESRQDLDDESDDASSDSSSSSSRSGSSGDSNSGSCCSTSGSKSQTSSSTGSGATLTGTSGHHSCEGDRQPRNSDDPSTVANVLEPPDNRVIDDSDSILAAKECDIKTNETNCPNTTQYNQAGSSREKGMQPRGTLSPVGSGSHGTTSQPNSNATQIHKSDTSHLENDTQNDASTSNVPVKSNLLVESTSNQSQQHITTSNSPSTSSPNSSLIVPTSTKQADSQDTPTEFRRTKRTLRPAPSPSPSLSAIDPNNNKNNNLNNGLNSQSMRAESLSGFRKTNFSKSASGSRLINRTTPSTRPNVCDCLAQNCGEKEHSNRRQFIEHYYNSRTRLPTSTNAMSSFNINTPLNRLSECDAITKRLLSSPIRSTNIIESPTRRAQVKEVDKARRASLGTNTMTDQVFLFSSNQFNSLELSYRNSPDANDQDDEDNQEMCDEFLENTKLTGENDVKVKQQQGRSLSVCDEDTLKPRFRKSNPNHSSNLNRAVSLAYESSTSKRLLTIIPLFGCDIKALEQLTKIGLILPPAIDSAVDHLLANGADAVGIFRKSGVKSRILSLKQRIEANQDAKIDELNKGNEFSIYDIADLVKLWFRELKPTPLMTKESIKIISDHLRTTKTQKQQLEHTREESAEFSRSSQTETNCPVERRRFVTSSTTTTGPMNQAERDLKERVNAILSPGHRALFSRALSFFASIASRCETNQMTSQNLAICLTPSLCATETDQESIIIAQKALEYCIDNYRILF